MLSLLRANGSILSAYDVTVDIFDSQYDAIHNIGNTIQVFFEDIIVANHSTSAECGSGAKSLPLLTLVPKLISADGQVATDVATDLVPPLFFGPENSAEVRVIAQVAPKYNLICVSSDAKGTDLSDRKQYPLFFRTAYTTDVMVPVARFILQYFNYSNVGLAYVDKPIPSETLQKVDVDLRVSAIANVLFRVKFTLDDASYRDLWKTIDAYDARIIVSYVNEADTFRIFCSAISRPKEQNALQYNASRYLFLFLGSASYEQLMPPPSSSSDHNNTSAVTWAAPNCTRQELSKALVGSMIVTFPSWAPDETRLDFTPLLTSLQLQQRCKNQQRLRPQRNGKIFDCNPTTLDVYWTAFMALDATDRRLRSQQPSRSLQNFTYQASDIAALLRTEMTKVQFSGASGTMAFSAATGERAGDLLIAQYQRTRNRSDDSVYDDDDYGFLHVFRIAANAKRVQTLAPLQFSTFNGLPPYDKAPIIVSAAASSYDGNVIFIIIVVVIVALIILVGSTIALVYLWYRRQLQRTLDNPPWLIDNQKIMFKSTALASVLSTTSDAGQKSVDMGSTPSDYTTPAVFNGQTVAVQHIPLDAARLPVNKQTHLLLINFRDNLQHSNVVRFLGYALSPHQQAQYLLWEHCAKGSLEQLVENDSINLDTTFQFAIMLDVAQGMSFLHKSFIHSHGALCAASCLIDKRFTVKVGKHGEALLAPLFGVRRFRDFGARPPPTGGEDEADENVSFYSERRLYWAPELLRQPTAPVEGTQQADVYAFAITIYVLLTRSAPFESSSSTNTETLMPHDVLERVRATPSSPKQPPFRPDLTLLTTLCDKRLVQFIENCWQEEATNRPTFGAAIAHLQSISGFKTSNITDQLFRRLEQYADDMELLVEERTRELQMEKQRSDALLNSILPPEIAEQLKRNGSVQPETFESVTIFFSDIVGFTTLSSDSTAVEIITLLNTLYTVFDAQIDLFDAYKVETIGDAYMVVSGLPHTNGNRHSTEIASLSLALLFGIKTFVIPHRPDQSLKLRVGIHTGPCVAGVVGIKMPRYCLFGDTVNTASRMESTGEAHRIHISEATQQELLRAANGVFMIEPRGTIDIKGKGSMRTYWLLGSTAIPVKIADQTEAPPTTPASTPETMEVQEEEEEKNNAV